MCVFVFVFVHSGQKTDEERFVWRLGNNSVTVFGHVVVVVLSKDTDSLSGYPAV